MSEPVHQFDVHFEGIIRSLLPALLRRAARVHPEPEHQAALREAAAICEAGSAAIELPPARLDKITWAGPAGKHPPQTRAQSHLLQMAAKAARLAASAATMRHFDPDDVWPTEAAFAAVSAANCPYPGLAAEEAASHKSWALGETRSLAAAPTIRHAGEVIRLACERGDLPWEDPEVIAACAAVETSPTSDPTPWRSDPYVRESVARAEARAKAGRT